MDFRLWIESETMRMPIASIVMTKCELYEAISNIIRGYPAVTEGPVEVAYLTKSKRYQLINGYHRMVKHMLEGQTNVEVIKTQDGDWSLPSVKFRFQPDKPFKGLEDFIEPYMLRKL